MTRTRQPTHPGGILMRHYMEPLKLSVSAVACGLMVSRKTVSKIVNERGAVTPEMALRLSKAFRTSPGLWLNLQRNYDLWHATHDSAAWKRVRVLAPYAPMSGERLTDGGRGGVP